MSGFEQRHPGAKVNRMAHQFIRAPGWSKRVHCPCVLCVNKWERRKREVIAADLPEQTWIDLAVWHWSREERLGLMAEEAFMQPK